MSWRCCCAAAGLGGHSRALLVGDSVVRLLFDELCQHNVTTKANQRQLWDCVHESCTARAGPGAATVLFVSNAGQMALSHIAPSSYTAATVLPLACKLFPREPPTLFLSDFGVLHLLHMHPTRPWYDAATELAKSDLGADWRGYRTLAQWVGADLRAYRQALSPPRLVAAVMTPYILCEARFTGPWKAWLIDRRLEACTAWVRSHLELSAAPRNRTDLETCNYSTMDAAGTHDVARQLRNAAQAHGALLLDGAQMSLDLGDRRCNATTDGVHYPALRAPISRRLREMLTRATEHVHASDSRPRLRARWNESVCVQNNPALTAK